MFDRVDRFRGGRTATINHIDTPKNRWTMKIYYSFSLWASNVSVGCALCKGGVFQWVRVLPGNSAPAGSNQNSGGECLLWVEDCLLQRTNPGAGYGKMSYRHALY